MQRVDDVRRPILIAAAALLVVLGLILALSAPGAAPASNKAQGYGGPVLKKPTNPKTTKACDDYYGKGENRKSPDARECLAKVKRYKGNRKCNTKSGSAKTDCKKAVKSKYKKAIKKIKKQRKAEKACQDAQRKAADAIPQDDPNYGDKFNAVSEEMARCIKKARS